MKIVSPDRKVTALVVAILAGCSPATLSPTDPEAREGGGAAQSITLSLQPSSVQVEPGGAVAFVEAVHGTTDDRVAWELGEAGGGTIDAAGNYVAPTAPGVYHVVARSLAEPSVSATATVTVTVAESGVGSGVGTGGAYRPSFVSVSGNGTGMPSTAGAVTADCTSATDNTSCLNSALASAASQGVPLLLPFTPNGYPIRGTLNVATSVIGTGSAMPTIRMTGDTGGGGHWIMLINGSNLGIYNVHLKGSFDGSNAGGEFDRGMVVVGSNITLRGNLIEDTMGDSVQLGDDTPSPASDVYVDNNTFRNPYRDCIFPNYSDHVWIGNNVCDKQVNYVSGIDFEPDHNPGDTYAEVAYNEFVMNNRTPGQYGSDGKAISAWQQNGWGVTSPGGHFWIHHNYGTFGTGLWMIGSTGTSTWVDVNVADNGADGSTEPP
jgi:hypothetical protein